MQRSDFKNVNKRPARSRASFQGGQTNKFNRTGPSRARRFAGSYIDPSKFINKAQPIEQQAPYVPETTFAEFKIHDALKKNIADRNFVHPTPIQDKTIAHSLEGKDVIGLANTGTGKTGAFLIPMINKIISNPSEKLPFFSKLAAA